MTRLLVVGDTHRYLPSIKQAVYEAQQADCSGIIQVGDSGFYPQTDIGRKFLDETNRLTSAAGLLFEFVCGNHEDHYSLGQYLERDGYDSAIYVRANVGYRPRSCVWEVDGFRFMALGGAYSIDRAYGTQDVDWWPQEVISAADVERAMNRGPVDVMFTHDSPLGTIPWTYDSTPDRQKDRWPESRANRAAISAVLEVAQPQLLFHGHYHYRYTAQVGVTRVEGLDCNGQSGSSYVLDTAELNRTKNTSPS